MCVSFSKSTYSGAETGIRSSPWVVNCSHNSTSLVGSRYRSGLISKPLIKLKTAVVAPIARASVRMATVLKAGDFTSWRSAYRRSVIRLQSAIFQFHSFHPQRFDEIGRAGTPRWQKAGNQRYQRKRQQSTDERRRV